MDFNLGQIFGSGLVPQENNMALNYLSYFFSKGLVFGGQSGEDASVYMVLLGSLSVFYLAVSLIIIVFLAVQKAYLTARDKEYAGQEDKNKLFALLMVLVMAMLAPVPGHNGLSLCQYISVKLFVAGSNLADWTAIKFLNLSSMTGTAVESKTGNQQNIRYYAFQRFVDASKKFNCAKALVAHNYLDSTGSVSGLNGMMASNLYRDLRSECGLPYQMVDVQYPDLRSKMTPSVVARIDQENERSENKATYLKEMECYMGEYAKLLGGGYIKLDRASNELRLTPRFKDATENKTIWQGIAISSAQCLLDKKVIYQDGLGNYVKASNLSEADKASSTDSNPATDLMKNPQGGWIALGDHFSDAREVGNEGGVDSGVAERTQHGLSSILDYDLESKVDPISEPLMAKLDPKLQVNVSVVNATFTQVLAKVTQEGWLNWNPSAGAGTDQEWQGVAKNVGGVIGFSLLVDNTLKVFLPGGQGFSDTLMSMSGSKDALTHAGPLRGRAKISAISKISNNFRTLYDKALQKKAKALEAEKALDGLPWVGPAAKTAMFFLGKAMAIANGVFDIIADIFGTSTGRVLMWLLMLVSVLEFLPKLIIGFAAFVWIYKCVMFVFTAPLGLTIALLPKTRIGHDTWKTGLALIMTPFLYIICFIVAITLIDISLEFAWDTMMGSYNFSGAGIMEILMELLNGTLLLKLTAFLGFYIFLTVFAMLSILKGPQQLLQTLGITWTGPGVVDALENKIGHYSRDFQGEAGQLR